MPTTLQTDILSTRLDVLTYPATTIRIIEWARKRESRYVCVANTHSVIEALDNPRFREVMINSDLSTPDGMPLVWGLKLLGRSNATRIYGPDLTLEVCRAAAESGVPIALYGGKPETLARMTAALRDRFPDIDIRCSISPPFRPLTPQEDESYTRQLSESGAGIVFVGIGCPKQELWMAAHRGRIPAVMIGVGAAFDFLSGEVAQAPRFIQSAGLEWLFRLCMEPRRLWRRYATVVPRFSVLFMRQLAVSAVSRRQSGEASVPHESLE